MMHPMLREYPKDPYSHGEDGLGNHFFPEPKLKITDKSPAQLIIDAVLANPGEVTLVCTSCLTNVAVAFMSRPDIIPLVKEIYHIGGAYGITEYAYRNAAEAGKKAVALCTISNLIFSGEACTTEERQKSFDDMIRMALSMIISGL